jgi:hypothetical protein
MARLSREDHKYYLEICEAKIQQALKYKHWLAIPPQGNYDSEYYYSPKEAAELFRKDSYGLKVIAQSQLVHPGFERERLESNVKKAQDALAEYDMRVSEGWDA